MTTDGLKANRENNRILIAKIRWLIFSRQKPLVISAELQNDSG